MDSELIELVDSVSEKARNNTMYDSVIVERLCIEPRNFLYEELNTLPVGTGYKGGTARSILKHSLYKAGLVDPDREDIRSELDFDGDYDVLVHISENISEPSEQNPIKKGVIKSFADKGLELEYKDIEVCTDIEEYFRTRDITQNEVLAFRESEDSWGLYFTPHAVKDSVEGVSRSMKRSLHTGFTDNYFIKDGKIILTERQLQRVLVRGLKGHAKSIQLPEGTLEHYKENGLNDGRIFSFLKPYYLKGDEELEKAVDYLKVLGLVGDDNYKDIWQSAFWSMLKYLVFTKGETKYLIPGRLLKDPTDYEIDKWITETTRDKYYRYLGRRQERNLADMNVTPNTKTAVHFSDNRLTFYNFYVDMEAEAA